MAPLRGQIWVVAGHDPRTVLVISGNMYNGLPDWPYLLAMDIVTDPAAAPASVDIGNDRYAIIDSIGRVPKRIFTEQRGELDRQALTDVDNWLFKILATN